MWNGERCQRQRTELLTGHMIVPNWPLSCWEVFFVLPLIQIVCLYTHTCILCLLSAYVKLAVNIENKKMFWNKHGGVMTCARTFNTMNNMFWVFFLVLRLTPVCDESKYYIGCVSIVWVCLQLYEMQHKHLWKLKRIQKKNTLFFIKKNNTTTKISPCSICDSLCNMR